jgi:hypothetical protein
VVHDNFPEKSASGGENMTCNMLKNMTLHQYLSRRSSFLGEFAAPCVLSP